MEDPEKENDENFIVPNFSDIVSVQISLVDFKPSTVDIMTQDYYARLEEYRTYFLTKEDEQHALVFRACKTGEIPSKFLNDKLDTINKHLGDSDFAMQPLIRLLYQDISGFPKEMISEWEEAQRKIIAAFTHFPFWPMEGGDPMINIVFWSENHLFMTLSAAYLFFQKQSSSRNWERGHIECTYLRAYLDLHLHEKFNGVFEVNSHVYLPFTLIALMNLYDFAHDEELRAKSKRLIDRIVYLLMLGTDPCLGVANLSSSARAFLRTRLRNHGHSINILLYLLLGKAPNTHEGAALLSHILLTTWEPDMSTIHDALYFKGFQSFQVSPSIELLLKLLGLGPVDHSTPDSEYTPFVWSAGLVTHPKFLERSHAYINKYKLNHNTHLWPLRFLLHDFSESYRIFSTGQAYTDIILNVYKQPDVGLIMTSFENFSPRRASFQQLPFIINMAGVPIWAQSGAGSESMAGFALTNTHNPIIRQQDDILVLTYLAPRVLTSSLIVGNMFSYKVRFFWPADVFLDSASLVLYGESYNKSLSRLFERYEAVKYHRKHVSMPIVNYVANSLPKVNFFGKKNLKKHKAAINMVDTLSTATAAATVVAQGGTTENLVDVLRRRFEKRHLKILQKCNKISYQNNHHPELPNNNEETDKAEDNDTDEDNLLREWEDALLRQNQSQTLWKIAERGQTYVALLCTKKISCVERYPCKDANLNPSREGPTAASVRLVCHAARHSWIVVVGSKKNYPSIAEFVDNKLRHIHYTERDETNSTGQYHLVVDDASTHPHRLFVVQHQSR